MGAGVLCLFGCGKSAPPPSVNTTAPANPLVDTSKLKTAFVGALPGTVGNIDSAIEFINATNYNEALTTLQPLAQWPKLTPAQKQVVEDVIAKLQALGATGTP